MSVDYRSINARSSNVLSTTRLHQYRPYIVVFVVLLILFGIYGTFSSLPAGSNAAINPLPVVSGDGDVDHINPMSVVTGEKKMAVLSVDNAAAVPSIMTVTNASSFESVVARVTESEADPRKLTFVWEMIACGTGGFQTEIIDIVMGLYEENIFGRLGIFAPVDCWPPGLPQETVDTLEFLRKQPMEQWKIDMFVRHAPPSNYISNFPHLSLTQRPTVMIGRSMVEIDAVDESMISRLPLVDDVWVPSKHSLDAYLKMGAPAEKFYTVHEPIQAELYDRNKVQPLPLPGLRKFNFQSIFKWEGRKGVDLLLRSFFEEFTADDDVTLIIQSHLFGAKSPYRPDVIRKKISNYVEQLGLHKKKNALPLDRIIVISERVPQSDMLRIYRTADAFVLPTHGEGWGLPIIEAMTMEVPTIATDYSGIREYLNKDTGFPIKITGLEPAMGLNFEAWMRWASVDLSHFRSLMRQVYEMSPDSRAQLGRNAREYISTHFTRAKIAMQVADRAKYQMVKFNVPGSAMQVCRQEMASERKRAHRIGISLLGDESQTSTNDLTDQTLDCSMRGKRQFFKQWDGRAGALYSSFPQYSELDDIEVDIHAVDGQSEHYKQNEQVLDISMNSPYVTAYGMFNIFHPDSKVVTGANIVSWEQRHKDDIQTITVNAEKITEYVAPSTPLNTLSTYIRSRNTEETKENKLQHKMKNAASNILQRKKEKEEREQLQKLKQQNLKQRSRNENQYEQHQTPYYYDSPSINTNNNYYDHNGHYSDEHRSTTSSRYDYSGDGYGDTFGHVEGEDDE